MCSSTAVSCVFNSLERTTSSQITTTVEINGQSTNHKKTGLIYFLTSWNANNKFLHETCGKTCIFLQLVNFAECTM